jgi:UDP-N-acetyl-D-glucosamine dehydrogenase
MSMGAKILYHDPFIPKIKRKRQWPVGPELKSQPLTSKIIAAQDAVLITTDHTAVDYNLIAERAKLIIDSRGVYRKPMTNVVKA